MDDKLFKKRHSYSHVLAQAVLQMFPEAKFGVGPAIENGFYYDMELPRTLIPEDLPLIEEKMREIMKAKQVFEYYEEPANKAIEFLRAANQPYKVELVEDLVKNEGIEKVSFYKNGEHFVDLCEGPHVEDTGKLDLYAFKLDKIAGAYWRGDEKRPMLQRIYGLAFNNRKDLDAHLKMIEEAKKRDHRKLGKELGLFTFSELVGSGLPLWTPKGTILRELLNDFVWELRKVRGYQKVAIPHITKKDLYETSGHWAKYAEDLFKIETRENNLYAMKPMNCPHHTQIFDCEPRSYRDMPQRFCETTMVYRDEQSGELSGLSRVLSITQDDAHVFCRRSQIEEEAMKIWDIIDTFYGAFGFELKPRLSRHDPEKFEKYSGTKETWKMAEDQLISIIEKRGAEYVDGIGEAAFYGPKIDFMSKDSLGREHQVATIQLDFSQPESFNLYCINEQGEKERVTMIHCAIMGSIERFLSVFIEHCAGAFPVWLAPVQVAILPVAEVHTTYAREIREMLESNDIRVQWLEEDSLGKRIRDAEMAKIPYMLVIGDKEIEGNTLAVRDYKTKKQDVMEKDAFVKMLLEKVKTRAL
ncbi:MAG: threonine--tRNA ligase [Candidatus Gracilibacteria bacterium]